MKRRSDDEAIKHRLAARDAKRDEVSDARLEDFEHLAGLYEPPSELAGTQLIRVRTMAPLEETLIMALKAMAQAHLRSHTDPCEWFF